MFFRKRLNIALFLNEIKTWHFELVNGALTDIVKLQIHQSFIFFTTYEEELLSSKRHVCNPFTYWEFHFWNVIVRQDSISSPSQFWNLSSFRIDIKKGLFPHYPGKKAIRHTHHVGHLLAPPVHKDFLVVDNAQKSINKKCMYFSKNNLEMSFFLNYIKHKGLHRITEDIYIFSKILPLQIHTDWQIYTSRFRINLQV